MDWTKRQDDRVAVITYLSDRTPGGAGRTALMKFCYLLQALKETPLGYRFTLYAYGPFDSEVLSDLGTAEAREAVSSEIFYYPGGYGYQITPGPKKDSALKWGSSFIDRYRADLDWVIAEFGSHASADLELESTIIYADHEAARDSESLTMPELAKRVHGVKPKYSEATILARAQSLLGKGFLKGKSLTLAA